MAKTRSKLPTTKKIHLGLLQKHGTPAGYRAGCRCIKCRLRWRKYAEFHRLRRLKAGQCYDCTGKRLKGHKRCARHEAAVAKRRKIYRAKARQAA